MPTRRTQRGFSGREGEMPRTKDDQARLPRRFFHKVISPMEGLVKTTTAVPVFERMASLRMLLRWKGSVWRELFWELIIFLLAYYSIIFLYWYVIQTHELSKAWFLRVVTYMNSISQLLSLTFLLGFYVNILLSRYWTFCKSFPSLHDAIMVIHTNVRPQAPSTDKVLAESIKHALCRYLHLAWIIHLRPLSQQLQKRFSAKTKDEQHGIRIARGFSCCEADSDDEATTPAFANIADMINNDGVVKETLGLLITEDERDSLVNCMSGSQGLESWVPLKWCLDLAIQAEIEGVAKSSSAINSEIIKVREQLVGMSVNYKYNVPLIYIQTIIIVVYCYYLGEIFNINFIDDKNINNFEVFIPFVPIVRFLIFMGWFKTGMRLINPLFEEQSHFPTSELLDYSLRFAERFALTTSLDLIPTSLEVSGEEFSKVIKKDYEFLRKGLAQQSRPAEL